MLTPLPSPSLLHHLSGCPQLPVEIYKQTFVIILAVDTICRHVLCFLINLGQAGPQHSTPSPHPSRPPLCCAVNKHVHAVNLKKKKKIEEKRDAMGEKKNCAARTFFNARQSIPAAQARSPFLFPASAIPPPVR